MRVTGVLPPAMWVHSVGLCAGKDARGWFWLGCKWQRTPGTGDGCNDPQTLNRK